MAKCKKCEKGWFFSKVLSSGLCEKCDKLLELEKINNRITKLKQDETKMKMNFQEQEIAILENITLLKEKKERVKLSLTIVEKDILAKITDFKIKMRAEEDKIKAQVYTTQRDVENQISDFKIKMQKEEEKIKSPIVQMQKNLLKMRSFYKAIENSIIRKKEQSNYCEYTDNELLENIELAEEMLSLSPTIKLKLNCMNRRELRKAFTKNEQVIQRILQEYKSRYTTKANASIYSLMVIALEAELQNVIYNLRYAKLEQSISDIKVIISKYQKIASDGNQNIAPTIEKFIGEIEFLFLEAIKIEYEYYIQKERIKEEQRMLKEQMRQEAAEKKILEEQKKKIEQEEAKFLAELQKVKELIKETNNQERIEQLQERFEKVQEQLSEVEKNKEVIINLQNGKAGYVYIISNLGSFGNNIFKIGMTRRLDPQDRVDELGSASVPFRFDVHSFIFSENAPELEAAMHKRLHEKRVNKVNLRKEFFCCDIKELEDIVFELEPTASFNNTMLAEQYNQSMAVDYIPENMIVDMEELEED